MSRFYKFPINIININLLHTHFNTHETTCVDIIFFYSLDIFIQIERFYKPLYVEHEFQERSLPFQSSFKSIAQKEKRITQLIADRFTAFFWMVSDG